MIDFHCHLDLYPDPTAVAAECRSRGMYVLSVTTTPSAWKRTAALARKGDRIRTALGLHPQLANERFHELPLFNELLRHARYVGEVGLDSGPECREHWSTQKKAFEHVLDSCRTAGGRILSIHSRHASDAVLDLLEMYQGFGTPVLHWFSGSLKSLNRAVRLGCWFSVGPAALRSSRGKVLIDRIPRNRILTESDGPLAQIHGRPIMPWEVSDALLSLSELWGLPLKRTVAQVHDNLATLLKAKVTPESSRFLTDVRR